MTKKIKLFLLTSSALIVNTAIASALTSCSFKNAINDIGGCDKKYGISMATYNRMESDFKDLYETQQNIDKNKGLITEQEYQANLLDFKSKLNTFHATLFSKDNKTLSYTIRTNALKDFANESYGIKLSRVSNINLNDELADIKASMLSSLFVYIDSYKVDDNQAIEIIEKANSQFDELKKEAIEEFGYDDIVSIIQYVQSNMCKCFTNITEEMDAIITQKQLKEFLNEYEINVKDNLNEQYYWDKIHGKYGVGNKEIELDDFNNIFTISPKSSPLKSSGTLLQSRFDNDLIPGYTLKPILHQMNGDPYKNEYSIDVDYILVNNRYIGKESEDKLTAHSSPIIDESKYEDENASIFDLNTSKEEREYTNYKLPITKKYEEKQINQTYFNGKDFKISWSTSDEYGFDDFWTNTSESSESQGKLDVPGLALSGMMINGILFLDILDQAGKISLTGGSYELNGIEKVQNKDSKQWELSINGEKIDGNDVQWQLISATTTTLPNFIKINNGIVSWTDQITAGVYEFYVLVDYKGIKIQTPLITLTISFEQIENVENFNNVIRRNMLYDENTYDQKLLDFANNVDLCLDYIEVDYDTEFFNKKGEIQVNNFIISYKNSENQFDASINDKNTIENAINVDSNITTRYSNSLWEHIKENYDTLTSGLNMEELRTSINSTCDDINSISSHFYIMVATFAALIIVATIVIITILLRGKLRNFIRVLLDYCGLIILISLVLIALGVSALAILYRLDKPNIELKSKLDKLDPSKKDSYAIVQNINNDKVYFDSKADKAKFNNLEPIKAKNKKVYYESGYMTKKNKDNESDLEEYFGGQDNAKLFMENLKDVGNGFYWLILLGILSGLLLIFIIYLIFFAWMANSASSKMNDLRLYDMYRGTYELQNWENEHPFLKSLPLKYFQFRQSGFWKILIGWEYIWH